MTPSFLRNRRRLVSLQQVSDSAGQDSIGRGAPAVTLATLPSSVTSTSGSALASQLASAGRTQLAPAARPVQNSGVPATADSHSISVCPDVAPLRQVDAQIFRGQTHAFLTERPTRILRLLSRLEQPTDGRILWQGERNLLRRHPRGVAYVPQGLSLTPGLTVDDELLISLASAGQNIDADRFEQLLQAASICDLRETLTQNLSTCQAYRVVLLRALMLGADLLAVEEPTASLPQDAAEAVMETLACFAAAGIAVVIQTRSPEVAARCDMAFLLLGGRVLGEFAQPRVDVLRAEYAAALLPASSAPAPGNEVSVGLPRFGVNEAAVAGNAEDDLSPRWVPTRSGESVPLVPIPVAVLPDEEWDESREDTGEQSGEEAGEEPGEDVGVELGKGTGEEAPAEAGVQSPADSQQSVLEADVIPEKLPEIPRAPYVEMDVDSIEVIARAQDILKELPGSVVPEREG